MGRELGDLFQEVFKKHRILVQEYLRQHNLYLGQHRILFALQKHPNITLTELATILDITKESLSVSLKRLDSTGLIHRVLDDDDKRRYVLSLSQQGETVAVACRIGFDEINKQLFDTLTTEEQETQRILFQRMLNIMDEEENV